LKFAASEKSTRPTRGQQPERMRRIGVLIAYAESDSTAQSWLAAFRAALAKLGWTEGSNLRIELRWSGADADRIRTLVLNPRLSIWFQSWKEDLSTDLIGVQAANNSKSVSYRSLHH
jgi:hypothetical protein